MKKRVYLCFDIGATTTKIAYIDIDTLKVIARNVFNTIESNKLFSVDYLIKNVTNEISNGINEYSIMEIGISTSGGVDMDTCEISFCNKTMSGYVGTNWRTIIKEKFNIKTTVLNDVKAAGLSEFSNRKISSGVMVTLGTGFGAAIYIDGKLYAGNRFCAGEVGQMMWPFNHSITVDTACSAVVTTNKIREMIKDQNFKLTDSEKIKNIPEALLVKEQWMKNVAYILKVLNYFYDPQVFIIGGGVSKHKELIFEIVNFLPSSFKQVEVAKDENDAAFFGLIIAMKNTKRN